MAGENERENEGEGGRKGGGVGGWGGWMRGQCTGASIRREKCGALIRGSEKAAAAYTKGLSGREDWNVREEVR